MNKMNKTKRVFITGIKGQDGYYLSELLKEKGYEVTGIDQGEGLPGQGDITDKAFVDGVVGKHYDEIYNLAGVSTVANPGDDLLDIMNVVGMAPVNFLEAIRKISPGTRFFQASSAEMYGDPVESPQNEGTSLQPKTPYGVAKMFAHRMVEEYRMRHGVYAVSGILFNHESPRRGTHFVTRKITSTLARIAKGSTEKLTLGNLDAARDWSYAGDIVRGMHLSLAADQPDTYVFASGEVHTVREFVDTVATILGITPEVEVDPALYRPLDIATRRGDISKASRILGWKPEVTFAGLVRMMVEAEKP
jgi:GDPmannose 4,6-dehydratase